MSSHCIGEIPDTACERRQSLMSGEHTLPRINRMPRIEILHTNNITIMLMYANFMIINLKIIIIIINNNNNNIYI